MNTKIKIMKKIKLLPIILFCMIILSASHCEKHEPTALPPETQTGANTLGCYVDGKLFVASREYTPFGHYHINATFSRNLNHLGLGCYGKNGRMGLELQFNDIVLNVPKLISTARFLPKDNLVRDCFLFGDKNTGEIIITKFDTVNCIVSGKFKFQGKCSDIFLNVTGDSVVNVTDGRFDIKLEITDL
jgi:hypothetical protein